MSRTDTEPGTAGPSAALLTGVFVISGSVMALEILLTRLFAAVLAYHFAFLIISIAICGLGLGGMLVSGIIGSIRIGPAGAAAGFSLSSLLLLMVLLHLFLPWFSQAVWLVAVPALVPFVFAGAFLAMVFQRYPSRSAAVYSADLAGAAVAAPGVVLSLGWLGMMPTYVLVAAVSASAGLVSKRRRRMAVSALAAVVLTGGLGLGFGMFELPSLAGASDSVVNPLFAEENPQAGHEIVLTRWDAFARTDVVRRADVGDDVLFIYSNGHVPSMMLNLTNGMDHSTYDADANLASLPFRWKQPASVLSIGPGGGLDIVLARHFGATRIDGVEVNPAVVDLMNSDRFRAFNGDPYNWPGVQVVAGDGRTFVRRAPDAYDLVFLSLAKTTIRTMNLVLVEGYIYTVDAFGDYLDHLTEDGLLVLVTDDARINARLLTTAVAALTERGVAPEASTDYLAVVRIRKELMGLDPYEHLLVVSQKPIDLEAGARLERLAVEQGFIPELIPGRTPEPPYRTLMENPDAIGAFSIEASRYLSGSVPGSAPINLMPVTDDSPFFLDLSFGVPPVLVQLGLLSLGLVAFFSLWILWARRGSGLGIAHSGFAPALIYFSALGVAFMLVEIALIQRLILVLGHPTRAVTVALCALLIGGGVGSALTGMISTRRLSAGLRLASLTVSALAVVVAVYTASGHPIVLGWPLWGRIVWAAVLCGICGVAMGAPFPLGVRAVGKWERQLVPYLWGVNGVTSMLGSVLAAAIAKLAGFQTVMVTGALVYLLAMLASRGLNRRPSPESSNSAA